MSDAPDSSPQPPDDPGYTPVRDFLLFSLSVPERTLRGASGVVAGTLRESATLLVPGAFRSSKTYSVMVQQMLDFLAENVGGVAREEEEGEGNVENFVARKAVGNFVEMASMATFHLSPLTLLAIVSDVAYGSGVYVKELGDELKKQGVIDEDSTINHVDDLLEAVSQTASSTASAFNTPPLSVDGLRKTIEQTRAAVDKVDPTSVIPRSEMEKLWKDVHEVAFSHGVDPLAVSGAMTLYSLDRVGRMRRGALSTVVVAGTLFDRHVINHYTEALGVIREKGFYATLAATAKPYADAVWHNFSAERPTITEDLVTGRLAGRAWKAARRWMGGAES